MNKRRGRKIPGATMGAARRRGKACNFMDSPGGERWEEKEVETKREEVQPSQVKLSRDKSSQVQPSLAKSSQAF